MKAPLKALADRERGSRLRLQVEAGAEDAHALRLTYNSRKLAGPFAFNNDAASGVLLASSGGADHTALQIAGVLGFESYLQPAGGARGPLTPKRLVKVDDYATFFTRLLWANRDAEVASTSEEGVVKVYDVRARRPAGSLNAPLLMGLRESPRTPGALYVCSGKSVIAWDRRAPPEVARRLAESGDRVLDVEAAREGELLYTCDETGHLRAWDERAPSRPLFLLRDNTEGLAVNSLQIDRSGTRLLATSEKGHASLIDLLALLAPRLNPDQPVPIDEIPGLRTFTAEGYRNGDYFRGAYLSPCGEYVVGGSDDGRGFLWSSATGRLLRTIQFKREMRPAEDGAPAQYEPLTRPIVHVAMAPVGPARPPLLALSSDELLGIWQDRRVPVALGRELEGDVLELPPGAAPAPAGEAGGAAGPAGAGGDGDVVAEGDEDEDADAEEEEEQAPRAPARFSPFSRVTVPPPLQDWEEDPLGLAVFECAYGRGYAEQVVYTCMTCREAMGENAAHAGICRQCVGFCHRDHQIFCLGRKGDFRCDCGNSRMPANHRCTLAPEREPTNPRNRYGHNFDLKYCTCEGEDDGCMVQCPTCWDWFHFRCIGLAAEQDIDDDWEYVCAACAGARYPFLSEYPDCGPALPQAAEGAAALASAPSAPAPGPGAPGTPPRGAEGAPR
eukprot:tig00000350_g24345.t1